MNMRQRKELALCTHGANMSVTILIHPKSHIYVKYLLSGNISTRLRMHRVFLFKFMPVMPRVYDLPDTGWAL